MIYFREILRLLAMFWIVGLPILICISYFPYITPAIIISAILGIMVIFEKKKKWNWSGGYLRLTYGALVPIFLYSIFYNNSSGPYRLELIVSLMSIICMLCYPVFFMRNIKISRGS